MGAPGRTHDRQNIQYYFLGDNKESPGLFTWLGYLARTISPEMVSVWKWDNRCSIQNAPQASNKHGLQPTSYTQFM